MLEDLQEDHSVQEDFQDSAVDEEKAHADEPNNQPQLFLQFMTDNEEIFVPKVSMNIFTGRKATVSGLSSDVNQLEWLQK